LKRVSLLLDRVRDLSQIEEAATVISDNNFPTGSGIASSASAFAALAVAGSAAAGLTLTESQLSVLARTGSGSASRSIPGGFVEWHAGFNHESSYAESIAPPDHWNLVDLIAIVSTSHKKTGSTGGHGMADTSVLQSARVQDATRRLNACRDALLEKDFSRFASIIEEDSNIMHAIMMTSNPKLIYWEPATVSVMKNVTQWREESGLSAAYTIDAGPNVHVICLADNAVEIESKLRALTGVLDVLKTTPGGPAQLLDS
jgi:diphosphomevalonate decarboxylase